jgi:hypothetical protein
MNIIPAQPGALIATCLVALALLTACVSDGYVGIRGGDYYEPYYADTYGGWGPSYRVGPYRNGGWGAGGRGGNHSYRPAPTTRPTPTIPTRPHPGPGAGGNRRDNRPRP